MIRLEHISKKYAETTAVDELSLEIEEGEVCVIIGPSGCGKTTTLRMINRLIEPTSGTIYVGGIDTGSMNPEALRRSMGYAIQSVGLFPHMSVGANIGVVPKLLGWEKRRVQKRVEELLRLVGLGPDFRDKYPVHLSGGEAQRVGVARALAADPPILLMDEPFGAVDPLTRERLQVQFARIQRELRKTVVLVTHDLDEAIRLASRIVIMRSGRVVQYDTPEAILSNPADEFVNDFVGPDRALKRLSRMGLGNLIRQSPWIDVDVSSEEAAVAIKDRPYIWVLDENNRLVGWITSDAFSRATSVRDVMGKIDVDRIAITDTGNLREALSMMLGQGLRCLPVIDREGRFVGEVTLSDLEDATSEADSGPW